MLVQSEKSPRDTSRISFRMTESAPLPRAWVEGYIFPLVFQPFSSSSEMACLKSCSFISDSSLTSKGGV